jgi:hypothetical protein
LPEALGVKRCEYMGWEAAVGSRGVALDSACEQVYDEEIFLYFLAVERTRSERSGRSFVLVLVDVEEQRGVSARIKVTAIPKLFSSLRLGIRGTDFIGWYREDHVVGIVLVEGGARPRTDVERAVAQRIIGALSECLPADAAHRWRVRVFQQSAAVRIESDGPQVAQLIPGEV